MYSRGKPLDGIIYLLAPLFPLLPHMDYCFSTEQVGLLEHEKTSYLTFHARITFSVCSCIKSNNYLLFKNILTPGSQLELIRSNDYQLLILSYIN